MSHKKKPKIKTISIFLLLSTILHLTILVIFLISKIKPVTPVHAPVEVTFVTPEELKQAKKEKKPPTQQKNTVTDQVVDAQKKLNDDTDPNTRFLSATNQRVEKQTKAERTGKFTNIAMGGRPTEGRKDGDKKSKVAEVKNHKAEEKGEMPNLKDLLPKFSLDAGPKAPPLDKNGDPSQSDDYLKDVNTGMQTLLSTREFVYYAYYSRIKEAIRQHWEPTVREKVKIIYRQGRTIASAKDRVTQVVVTLNEKGELLNVEILTQSGLIDLDNAAVEAFRAASPFPNPPKGMVESDGTIKIRWDFILEAFNESTATLRLSRT